jgi:hypothetical protein
LYRVVEPGNLEYKVLVDVSKLSIDKELERNEIEAMELALISMYKPIGNYAGVKGPYKFTK